MADLKWEDPPDNTHGPGTTKWDDIKKTLRANEGKWAVLVDETTPEPNKEISKIRASFTLKDNFVTRVQNKFDKPLRLWVMYNPDEAAVRRKRYAEKAARSDGPSDLARQRDGV